MSDWYNTSTQFIVEMHKQGMYIRMANLINDACTYNIHLGGMYANYSTADYTENQIRRMLKLKAFW